MENFETQVEQTAQTPEEPAVVDAPKESAAQRFAFLAKKESALQKQRAEIKAAREAMTAQQAEIEKIRQEIEAAKSKKSSYRTNPLSLLEENGLTYKELTDYILNNNTVSTESQIKAIQDRLDETEKRREQEKLEAQKRAEDQAREREAQVIQEFRSEISSFIKAKAETFELTALYDGSDLVYDTVEEYFNKTGKVLSIPEAVELVEKYFESQVEKAAKTKKLSSKLAAPSKPQDDTRQPAPTRTLSNTKYTSSTPSLVSPKVESDRMARAMAALDL